MKTGIQRLDSPSYILIASSPELVPNLRSTASPRVNAHPTPSPLCAVLERKP